MASRVTSSRLVGRDVELIELEDALQAAGDGAAVLVIEDLHWADRSTRGFISFLARSLSDERVLVIATYRSDELHRRHPLRPLLAEIDRQQRVRRLQLEPLAREHVREALH